MMFCMFERLAAFSPSSVLIDDYLDMPETVQCLEGTANMVGLVQMVLCICRTSTVMATEAT